jgi:hypothetical protein
VPRVTKVQASLRFSKEMPGGAWKAVELGAEASLVEGETYEGMLAEDLRRAFVAGQVGDLLEYVTNDRNSPPQAAGLQPVRSVTAYDGQGRLVFCEKMVL